MYTAFQLGHQNHIHIYLPMKTHQTCCLFIAQIFILFLLLFLKIVNNFYLQLKISRYVIGDLSLKFSCWCDSIKFLRYICVGVTRVSKIRRECPECISKRNPDSRKMEIFCCKMRLSSFIFHFYRMMWKKLRESFRFSRDGIWNGIRKYVLHASKPENFIS